VSAAVSRNHPFN